MSLKGTSLPSTLPTTRSECLYGVYTCGVGWGGVRWSGVGWGRFGGVGWGGVDGTQAKCTLKP